MAALAAAIITLEAKLLPEEIALVTILINKIHNHKKPAAATVAASKAVDATPDDADTNDPNSPYFVE